MKKQPLLLRALDFSYKELEALLRCAVKIMHADTRIRLEEESIINLIPALLQVVKKVASEDLRSEWRKKLISASYAIKEKPADSGELPGILDDITDFSKCSTCLVILFLIAGSDKHIDMREIDFIVNDIAKPWHYTVPELIDLLKEESDKVFIPEEIIQHLMNL